jgi:hypothetical protein
MAAASFCSWYIPDFQSFDALQRATAMDSDATDSR